MPNLSALYTALGLAAFALFYNATAWSQDSRWFRVELLVFARQAPAEDAAGAATAEQWEPIPELAYPGAARFLIYPELVAENLRAYPGTSLVDEYGRQIITLPGPAAPVEPDAIAPLRPVMDSDAIAAPDIPRAPGTGLPADPNVPALTAEAPADDAAVELAPLPRPFVVLPASYLEFRGKAALMQRSGRYDIVFHESWVQPVPAEARSLPIVLDRSGDTGQWPRLQGSVKLYLSRYLQVETNLWLNTAGSYLPGDWQMPAPPLGPPSLIIEEPLPAVIEVQEPAPAEAGAATGTAAAQALPAGTAAAVPAEQTAPEPAAASEDPLAEEIPELEVGPVYPYRHAVLLQQKRRMRSNEIHYIDHPLLGVVIKFTPVTAEDLAAIAAEQPPLPAAQLP